jgi:hypothetical protein
MGMTDTLQREARGRRPLMQQRAERDNAFVPYDEYEGRVW